MPHEEQFYTIEDTRELTVEYPELRVTDNRYRSGWGKIPGLVLSARYAYISDEEAREINLPRFNRQAREHYMTHGASYVEIEYGVEAAIARVRLYEGG